jgi:hypothetical protein
MTDCTGNGGAASDAPLEDDERPEGTGALGMRGIFAPVAVVVAIGLVFVAVYLAAFHAPRPHNLPLAVVGSAQATRSMQTGLNRVVPGGFKLDRVVNQRAARDAIGYRRAYGALVAADGNLTLLYAGANGPGVASLLESVAGPTAKAAGSSLTMENILPVSTGDTRGLSIFYTAFGLVLAGFLFGTATYQVAPRLELRERLLSLLVFGVAGGILITLVAKAFSAVPGSFLGLAAVITLMAVAAGGFSMSLVRVLGGPGASLAAIILLVLGNSTSGGVLPRDFLPGWLHPLSEILPAGVGVRALYGLAYFHDDGLLTAVAVLCVWSAVCVMALYLRDVFDARNPKAPSFRTAAPADSAAL